MLSLKQEDKQPLNYISTLVIRIQSQLEEFHLDLIYYSGWAHALRVLYTYIPLRVQPSFLS